MNKDTIITIIGITSVGCIVFALGLIFLGGASKAGDAKIAAENPAPVQRPKELDEITTFKTDYGTAFAAGKYDDALQIASKALTATSANDPFWQTCAGNAAYNDDAASMSNQRRYEEAKKHYETVVLNPATENLSREWAQYRICYCLKNLDQWDQAVPAMKVYLEKYLPSPREHDIRLLYCKGLFALKHGEEGLKEADKILKGNAPDQIKSYADIERANYLTKQSKENLLSPPAHEEGPAELVEPAALENEREKDAKAEIAPLPDEALKIGPRSANGAIIITPECLAKINRLFKLRKTSDAKHELQTYLGSNSPLSKDDQARLDAWWGDLIREIYRTQAGGNKQ